MTVVSDVGSALKRDCMDGVLKLRQLTVSNVHRSLSVKTELRMRSGMSSTSDCESSSVSSSTKLFESIWNTLACKLTNHEKGGGKKIPSGPCMAFIDWPIPKYPDDYEWDDWLLAELRKDLRLNYLFENENNRDFLGILVHTLTCMRSFRVKRMKKYPNLWEMQNFLKRS